MSLSFQFKEVILKGIYAFLVLFFAIIVSVLSIQGSNSKVQFYEMGVIDGVVVSVLSIQGSNSKEFNLLDKNNLDSLESPSFQFKEVILKKRGYDVETLVLIVSVLSIQGSNSKDGNADLILKHWYWSLSFQFKEVILK